MGSNEPVRNECEVMYEIFHILNCGCEIAFIAAKIIFYLIVMPATT